MGAWQAREDSLLPQCQEDQIRVEGILKNAREFPPNVTLWASRALSSSSSPPTCPATSQHSLQDAHLQLCVCSAPGPSSSSILSPKVNSWLQLSLLSPAWGLSFQHWSAGTKWRATELPVVTLPQNISLPLLRVHCPPPPCSGPDAPSSSTLHFPSEHPSCSQ